MEQYLSGFKYFSNSESFNFFKSLFFNHIGKTPSIYNLTILVANVSINLLIGPLIIIAIIGLNSPSKNNCTCVSTADSSFNFAVNVKGNLLLAAPNTTSLWGVALFLTNFISGMPFKPNSKQFSSITSYLAMFSGINFSKFLISVSASNK